MCTHLVSKILGLCHEVAGLALALRNLAEFLLVVLDRIQSVAPRARLTLVRVAAVVVVAEAVAPLGGAVLRDIGSRLDCHSLLPGMIGGPLLACPAADGGGHEAAVALALIGARRAEVEVAREG